MQCEPTPWGGNEYGSGVLIIKDTAPFSANAQKYNPSYLLITVTLRCNIDGQTFLVAPLATY